MFDIFNFPNLILLPIRVWLVGILVTFLVAIPFWFIWSYLEVGKSYFSFFPRTVASTSILGGCRNFCLFIDLEWDRFRLNRSKHNSRS